MSKNKTSLSHSANHIDIGAILQQKRIQQGCEVADIARQLNLTEDIIHNIESNQTDRLPHPVFIRGYIRNYLRLLDFSEEEADHIIAQFNLSAGLTTTQSINTETGKKHQEFSSEQRRVTLLNSKQSLRIDSRGVWWKIWLGISGAAISIIISWQVFFTSPSSPVQQEGESLQISDINSLDTLLMEGESDNQTATVSSIVDAPTSEITNAVPAPVLSSGLQFRFTEESWLQVMDSSGSTLHQGVQSADTTIEVSGLPPFRIRIGNAAATRLMMAGEPVDFRIYTRANVAKFSIDHEQQILPLP